VGLAARGLRDMNGGAEPIADLRIRARLRRRGRMVYVKSGVAAAALTILAMLG